MGHSGIIAVVASGNVLAEGVGDGGRSRAAEVVDQNFDGVAPAFEVRLGEGDVVVGRVGRQPGLNELSVDVDEGIAASCEGQLHGFVGTVCIECYGEGGLVTHGVELEALAGEFPGGSC